jgi:hypothetical protein
MANNFEEGQGSQRAVVPVVVVVMIKCHILRLKLENVMKLTN